MSHLWPGVQVLKKSPLGRALLAVLPLAAISVSMASEIIPPDMLLTQIIKDFRDKDSPPDHWAVDYAKIEKSDPQLNKQKVFALLRSIDPNRIKLADHDHLAKMVELLEPKHLKFHFEARDTKSAIGPPTFYVLVRIE
jgi:hypothetical protein